MKSYSITNRSTGRGPSWSTLVRFLASHHGATFTQEKRGEFTISVLIPERPQGFTETQWERIPGKVYCLAEELNNDAWDHPTCKNSKVFMAGFVDGVSKSKQMLNSGNGQIAIRMDEYNRGKELGVKSRSRI